MHFFSRHVFFSFKQQSLTISSFSSWEGGREGGRIARVHFLPRHVFFSVKQQSLTVSSFSSSFYLLQGTLVDVYAPGTNIYSVAIDNDQVREEGGREGEVEEEERRRRRRRGRRDAEEE